MKNKLRDTYDHHSEIFILASIVFFTFLLMWIFSPDRFLRQGNLQSMAFQFPELGLLSLAMMVVMINGGINLAIVSTANLSGITAALILTKLAQANTSANMQIFILAIVLALLISLIVGLLNGLLVAFLNMSSILSTLGVMTFLNGITILMTKGYVISGFPPSYMYIGNGLVFGIPFSIIIFIIIIWITSLLLKKTSFGFELYMIGTNPIAATYSGVKNKTVLLKSYMLSGVLCGIAGIIMSSRFNSAKSDYGSSYVLVTVLAAVLGGTSSTGGFGKVSGLVLSLIILQLLSSGLNLMQANAFLTRALWGVILILVMVVNFYTRKSSGRSEE